MGYLEQRMDWLVWCVVGVVGALALAVLVRALERCCDS
jgi:hypothetical protein